MISRTSGLASAFGILALGACQTAPSTHSGFLTSYEGLAPPGSSLRAVVNRRRDDRASDAIERVFITPAVFAAGADSGLSPADRSALLTEVDRQICFEISERFTVVPAADPETAIIRTAVVHVETTGRVASGVSAVVGIVNPVPVDLRAPGTTGALAIESEMLTPEPHEQIAAITWGRAANAIGSDSPSLSRIGDALQFAEPMGDAIGDTFASETREVRKIPDPDPCSQYGSRRSIPGALVGLATGLYVPEAERIRLPK